MRKVISVLAMIFLIVGLTACTEPNETPGRDVVDRVPGIIQILEDANYELTEHDEDAITYFQENTVDELGVEGTVTALYMGYLDGDNWVQVIGFDNSQGAYLLKTAFEEEQDEGQFVYLFDNAVVLTYTEETYNLFD